MSLVEGASKALERRQLSVYTLLKEATLEKIRGEEDVAAEETSCEGPGTSSIRVM